jgi:two-component system sensor histidine kinase PilS (NtrC family)
LLPFFLLIGGAVVRWLGGGHLPRGIPSAKELLRAVYIGRISVAAAVYLTALLKFRVATPADILVTSLLLVTALLVSAASYWHTHLRHADPSPTFLYLQAVFDVALITTVVHVTGGPNSDFAGLYVVLIAATAVLMPPASAGLVTLLAGLGYFAVVFFGHQGEWTPGVWIQLAVFAAVAGVTAYIASRVSVMGAEREALAGELRQVRLEASDVLRNLRTGVITVDSDGRLLYCNPAAEELLGVRSSEWTEQPIMPELARLAPEFWAAITATARRGVRQMRVEARVHRHDRTFPVGLTTTTLDPESGGPTRVTAIFADISDSKRLEELRLRAERLEAVAELSSSLAHEIKNPLASIRSSVEQIGRSKHADPDEKFLSNLIVKESDRLSRLLSEFLDFSRVRVTECRPVDLRQVAGAAIQVVREHPDCGEGVVIAVEGPPTLMEGDEDLLHRVVSNLVLNAVQASGKNARVTVRIGRPGVEDMPVGASVENPVALIVQDNGPGVPDSVRGRIFEPFVTGRIGGTGLGLAIVQRAVEAHRGLVLMDTVMGQGTTFTVYFPAARRKEEAA